MRRLALFALVALTACGGDETFVDIRADGDSLDGDRVRSAIDASPGEGDEIVISLTESDPGPEGVADAGVSRHVQLTLGGWRTLQSGDELVIAAHATLSSPDAPLRGTSAPYTVALTSESEHDARVRSISATSSCFCSFATLAEQDLQGNLRVLARSETTMRLSLELTVAGLVPGEAARRYDVDAVFDVALPGR